MIAYKLLRLRKDGTLGPLFVGRDIVIPVSEWMKARVDLPHPGLAHRPGFHCCSEIKAPHIKLQLKNGERRVWCVVQIEDYDELRRPKSQGGLWYIATHMKILVVLSDTNRKENK
jgi:hypothetical protein